MSIVKKTFTAFALKYFLRGLQICIQTRYFNPTLE